MKAVAAILRDRRRSQRGSVLSGVLIIVAFLAIIAGALMTELSTNLLLSRNLVNRVGNEATVNSALELTLNRLQSSALINGCPALSPVSLNGRTAALSYISCAPVVDSSSPQFRRIATSASFSVDGTHTVLPSQGRNDYVVGDDAGNVFAYRFDVMTQRWNLALGGSVTGPPLEMPDVNNGQGVIHLVPVSNPDPGPPGCGSAGFCVATIKESGGSPRLQCFMAAGAVVASQPAAGIRNNDLAYFGDGSGDLYVYDADDGQCARQDVSSIASDLRCRCPLATVAGPIVFSGPSGTDELYLVVSNGSSSWLVHYTYTVGDQQEQGEGSGLTFDRNVIQLPALAVGMALEPGTLPSKLAITFSGGRVSMAQIQSNFGLSLLTSTTIATGIDGAPYWCQCPGGDLIGVGGRNGLYLFDTGLVQKAAYVPSSSPAISTTPAADSAGDWFYGAGDGKLYEVQRQTGQTMALAASFGSAGAPISSSPMVGSCASIWICVYLGSADSSAYLVPLDARRAVVTACISSAPPACSGTNPRLWASVEVGSANSPNTVHVGGWSYYSP